MELNIVDFRTISLVSLDQNTAVLSIIQVYGSVIECDVVVPDLGVYLDSELSITTSTRSPVLASTTSGDCARFAIMSAEKS